MTGQIPAYGKNFRLVSLAYTPGLASRAYYLKQDDNWFIQSDKASKTWTIFLNNPSGPGAIPMGKPLPTFGMAMIRLLEGIDRGFYAITSQDNHREVPRS